MSAQPISERFKTGQVKYSTFEQFTKVNRIFWRVAHCKEVDELCEGRTRIPNVDRITTTKYKLKRLRNTETVNNGIS